MPIFTVKDEEIIRSCGLDSLVRQQCHAVHGIWEKHDALLLTWAVAVVADDCESSSARSAAVLPHHYPGMPRP